MPEKPVAPAAAAALRILSGLMFPAPVARAWPDRASAEEWVFIRIMHGKPLKAAAEEEPVLAAAMPRQVSLVTAETDLCAITAAAKFFMAAAAAGAAPIILIR